MKKKEIIVMVIVLLVVVVIGLYGTYATSIVASNTNDTYNVTLNNSLQEITVPSGSSKTIIYHITNTNNGKVQYGVVYSGSNIEVKIYNDSENSATGTFDYGENKYIKLYITNSGTTDSTASIKTVLGYENGGDLIIPSGYTLVSEVCRPYKGLAERIANVMFTPNTTVTNNSITYNYDTTHSLMEDIGGNIRYYGAEPNNYIYFNCSDYSNQTSSTCETWRIIGVFDGKVKIMRNSIIGSYSWDNKNTSTGAESANGKNDWTDARLMKLLNPGYSGTGGSLYYNSGSGSCYSGQNNATTTCNFTSTGIKNDTTRNLISDTLYYLGGHSSASVYSDTIYEKERGTTVYSGRPTTWIGKIALPYPSDYGYAADLGSCTQNLNKYNDSTCTSANWMKPILGTSSWGWLLTPHSDSFDNAWFVYSPGHVIQGGSTHGANGVVPVLYLSSELGIGSGTGMNSDPYRLSVS